MNSKALTGHGTFIYSAEATIGRYGSAENVVAAIKDLDMSHAWVRIHGKNAIHKDPATKLLIETLQSAKIAVAGWGWCQGDVVVSEAGMAAKALEMYGLTDYVADIEQGVSEANWTEEEIKKFFNTLKQKAAVNITIGISSFAFIDFHAPNLMKTADTFVDCFVPQIYWFWHPTKSILKAVGASQTQYPLNNPASYAKLCFDRWRQITRKPIVLTGQAYWGEHPEYTVSVAETKLNSFLQEFDLWGQIAGLNWWHIGGKGQDAMSFGMYQTIKNKKIGNLIP